MGFSSRTGRRPAEYASKSAHGHLALDQAVQSFLKTCQLPKLAGEVKLSEHGCVAFEPPAKDPITHVIALDSGYQEVQVRKEFPSATVCFFQFGELLFGIEDLERLEASAFIDPEDMARLRTIQRRKLVLPVRNITLKGEATLTHSVRRAVYEFFTHEEDDPPVIESLRWFLYREYDAAPDPIWTLASCPHCGQRHIPLDRAAISPESTFACPNCQGTIYLTDVLRLHEAIDDELGAGGILAYVATAIEQLLLVHNVRAVLEELKPAMLGNLLFIKDGPLAFFGQTANLHKPMRQLASFLFKNHNLYLAGLEKSGAFVEHAAEIAQLMEGGQVLLLSDEYIHRYIIPGKVDAANPYGASTYYGAKLIFKTSDGRMYVLTLPTEQLKAAYQPEDFPNLQTVLANVAKLKCDMYDNALLPVALVNKLVSLADHPSSKILQKFAIESLGG
jgi:hypothetical protein